jgi:hypothetical protein
MITCRKQLLDIPTSLLEVADDHVDQLCIVVLCRERPARLDQLTNHPVQNLDCIRGVDDTSESGSETKNGITHRRNFVGIFFNEPAIRRLVAAICKGGRWTWQYRRPVQPAQHQAKEPFLLTF